MSALLQEIYILQRNEEEQVDSSINQFSKNFSFSGKRTITAQFGPNSAQNYSALCLRFFLKHFSRMRHNKQTIVTSVSFLRTPVLVQLGNLSPIWVKVMQPYIASNCLMICSLRFLKCCDMMGCNIQAKIMLVILPNKFPSRQEQLI